MREVVGFVCMRYPCLQLRCIVFVAVLWMGSFFLSSKLSRVSCHLFQSISVLKARTSLSNVLSEIQL